MGFFNLIFNSYLCLGSLHHTNNLFKSKCTHLFYQFVFSFKIHGFQSLPFFFFWQSLVSSVCWPCVHHCCLVTALWGLCRALFLFANITSYRRGSKIHFSVRNQAELPLMFWRALVSSHQCSQNTARNKMSGATYMSSCAVFLYWMCLSTVK